MLQKFKVIKLNCSHSFHDNSFNIFFAFGSISFHSTDGNIEFCVLECKAFKVFLFLDLLELLLRFFIRLSFWYAYSCPKHACN